MGNVRLMVSMVVFYKIFVAARGVARLLAQTGLVPMDVRCHICQSQCSSPALRRRGWYTLSVSNEGGLQLSGVDPLSTAICEQCAAAVRRLNARACEELRRQRRLFVN